MNKITTLLIVTLVLAISACDSAVTLENGFKDTTYVAPTYTVFKGTFNNKIKYFRIDQVYCDEVELFVYNLKLDVNQQRVSIKNNDGSLVSCDPFEFPLIELQKTEIQLFDINEQAQP